MIKSIKEFKLINLIKNTLPNKYIGDDCAFTDDVSKQIISVDTFVENVHFSFNYSNINEIVHKTFNASFSDIAAMGGKPLYFLLSISAKNSDIICKFIKALKLPMQKLNVLIIGGDITYSNKLVISFTCFGKASKPIFRNTAKNDDLVYLSNYTGLSGAGLFCLKNKIKGFNILKTAHKKPTARFDISNLVNKYANSMIDISDGLLSELYHLANDNYSDILLHEIPIHPELKRLEKLLVKKNIKTCDTAIDFALYGGEDFELLYTLPKKYAKYAKGICIATITKTKKKPKITYKNKTLKIESKKQFLHF